MTIIGGASKHLNMVCTIRTAVSIVLQFALSVVHGIRRCGGLMVTVLDSGRIEWSGFVEIGAGEFTAGGNPAIQGGVEILQDFFLDFTYGIRTYM